MNERNRTHDPNSADMVDCTVQLWSVLDEDGFRSLVQFFLYQDPAKPATKHPFLGEAEGQVLVGWSVPLGAAIFDSREDLQAAYAVTPKGVPWEGLWRESHQTFCARLPEAESLPAGISVSREFARAHGLSVVTPRPDNPNILDEGPA